MNGESRGREEMTEPREDASASHVAVRGVERARAAHAPLHVVVWRGLSAFCAWWLGSSRPPRSRAELVVRWAASFAALAAAFAVAVRMTKPLRAAKPVRMAAASAEPAGVAFGLAEAARRDVFKELAIAEKEARRTSAGQFQGHAWSVEDQRASLERYAAHRIAQQRGLTLTQIYLILDEGIRNHWPGPDGQPLPAITPPLDPRQK